MQPVGTRNAIQAKQINIRHFYLDGNNEDRLLIKTNEKTISVFLQLKSENYRSRRIGLVTKSTKTIFIRREREKHLFRKANAYGFSYYIIKNQTSFDTICLSDELCHWKIPVQYLLEHGSFLEFKNEGFEKQIFLSLDLLNKFIVPANTRL